MSDSMLELWLTLLALNADEPAPENDTLIAIRNQWLRASHVGCPGCIPHELEDATSTPEGMSFVKDAVLRLSTILGNIEAAVPHQMLNLLGCGSWGSEMEISRLRDIATAFLDLLEFRVVSTVSTNRSMPGSWPPPGIVMN